MRTVYPKGEIEVQIGFDFVRSYLERTCISIGGKDWVANLQPFDDRKQYFVRLDELNQYILLNNRLSKPIQIIQWVPLPKDLKNSEMQGYALDLDSIVIVRDFLAMSIPIFKTINKHIEERNALRKYSLEIEELVSLLKVIDDIIGPNGGVKPDASPALSTLISKQEKLEKSLISVLNKVYKSLQKEKLTQDLSPTVKNGRYVIPVPSAIRNSIKGVIQGESGSKNISYIEPLEVIESNNDLSNVGIEINYEIDRLLGTITAQISKIHKSITYAETKVHYLDFLNAIYKYSKEFNAVIPIISNRNVVKLNNARHPKLASHLKDTGAKLVPLDFEFSKQKRIMIISGPNAGGKSVALKTFSLAQYSAQCAIPICTDEDNETMLFDNILTDIGDNQSIDSDLSTYSAHLSAMKAFLEVKSGMTFIAIDEIGAGTDPQLGGPMAEAMINHFEQTGYYGIITTHFSNLKAMEHMDNHLFNASMLYDTDKLEPMFKLMIGNPGSSFVFELAKRIGIPQTVVKQAKELAGSDTQQLEQYLAEIDSKQSALQKTREEIGKKEIKLDQLLADYERLKGNLVQSKNDILNNAKEEAREILKGANRQIEQTVKTIKEKKATSKIVAIERAKIEKKKDQVSDEKSGTALTLNSKLIPEKKKDWKVGDFASIDNETQAVEITQIRNNKAEVVYNSVRTLITLNRLYPIVIEHQPRPNRNIAEVLMRKMSTFKHKLDLRGIREEEAMNILRNYLDEAYSLGINEVNIIHGRGKGALKNGTKELLKSLPYIKEWKHDHADRGGEGATWVYLK